MESFLFQSTIYLLAACIAVPLAVRLGLGSVLGYLFAGLIIGPIGGIVGSETVEIQHFAEFGVVMMLFLIGLELEPRALWDMRHKLIGLGGLQITLTALLVTGLAMLAMGLPWSTGLAIGLIFSLSSTAIVLQTLNEKELMAKPGGRSAFSVLLTQDIAVIPMLAFLPLLALSTTGMTIENYGVPAEYGETVSEDHGGGHGDGHGGGHGDSHAGGIAETIITQVESLPGWGLTLITVGAIVLVVLGGHFLTRPIFRYIHLARLREMYTAVSLLFVVGVAMLMIFVGLSPALGSFLAGVVLANSEFRHELEADIEPFKGLLLGLFFITVGAGINFNTFLSAPVTVIVATLGVIALKAAVLYILAVIFKIRGRDRMLFALSLAQAGEFGFVLVGLAVSSSVLPPALASLLLLIIALSMLLTPLLFIAYDLLEHRFTDEGTDVIHDDIDEQHPVIIAGVGRFGQIVNRLVSQSGFATTVLDHDLETIELMRRFGFKGFFGDPTRPDLLHAAGLETARVLVVGLDDRDAAVRLVQYARKERDDIRIIARAYDRAHVFRLYQAGATDIVREMFDSSLRAGRYVLEELGLTEFEAHQQEMTFFRMDRAGMAELAQLWREGIPAANNEAYVAKAKELNRDLEAALLTRMTDQAESEANQSPNEPEASGPEEDIKPGTA